MKEVTYYSTYEWKLEIKKLNKLKGKKDYATFVQYVVTPAAQYSQLWGLLFTLITVLVQLCTVKLYDS